MKQINNTHKGYIRVPTDRRKICTFSKLWLSLSTVDQPQDGGSWEQ